MKRLLAILSLLAPVVTPALAEKPTMGASDHQRVECGLLNVCWNWDGSFVTEMCDTEGAPVWQYGVHANYEVPNVDCDSEDLGPVLGTILNGDYPVNSGERAILGTPFTVAPDCYLLEICHFYDTENSYDGGNVELYVGGAYVVIDPMGGYPDAELCESTYYYAWCVDGQPGFTDGPTGFARDCFDLSQFMDQEVQVAVKFGSDSSVTYPGWYIHSVVVGGLITPAQESTWSTIKSVY